MALNYFMNDSDPPGNARGMIVVGHSWAQGTFGGREEEIGNTLGMEVTAKTKIGSSINYAKTEMENAPGKYKCALLFTGINDYRNNPDDIKKSFDLLIGAADAKVDGRIYLVNVPYYGPAGRDKIDRINDDLRDLAKKYPNVVYIDLNAELNGKKHPEYSPSGLHPGNYNKIREFLLNEIMKNENPIAASKKQALAR